MKKNIFLASIIFVFVAIFISFVSKDNVINPKNEKAPKALTDTIDTNIVRYDGFNQTSTDDTQIDQTTVLINKTYQEILNTNDDGEIHELIYELSTLFEESMDTAKILEVTDNLIKREQARKVIIGLVSSYLSPDEISSLYNANKHLLDDDDKYVMLSSYKALSLLNGSHIDENNRMMIQELDEVGVNSNEGLYNIVSMSIDIADSETQEQLLELHRKSADSKEILGDFPIDKSVDEIYLWLNAKSKLSDSFQANDYYQQLLINKRISLLNHNPNIAKIIPYNNIVYDIQSYTIASIESNNIENTKLAVSSLKRLESVSDNTQQGDLSSIVNYVISLNNGNDSYQYFYNSYF